MKLTRLNLSHFRGVTQLEIAFKPGMNLIVGENGAGKTTLLDACCVLLSHAQAVLKFTASKPSRNFDKEHIQIGASVLTAQLQFEWAGMPLVYDINLPREDYAAAPGKEGLPREQSLSTGRVSELSFPPEKPTKEINAARRAAPPPLAIFYSPRRALTDMESSRGKAAKGGVAAAFADTLESRELKLGALAEWWRVKETLAEETGNTAHLNPIHAMQEALSRFMPGFRDLRLVMEPKLHFVIKKAETVIDVRLLSDGERGVLALVLETTRRLAQANPEMNDPAKDASAVILIDEIDLHLHPKWQRQIVEQLETTFPRCQFIATTHSPQILSSVAHEKIWLMEPGRNPYNPDQTRGMDSSWILRHVMGVSDRPLEVAEALTRISDAIRDERYSAAKNEIENVRREYGEFPEIVRLETKWERLRTLSGGK